MILNSQSLNALNDAKTLLINSNKETNNLRNRKILELTEMMYSKSRARLQEMLLRDWNKKLGITNAYDMAFHTATERVRFLSKLPLKADTIKFYNEWKTVDRVR